MSRAKLWSRTNLLKTARVAPPIFKRSGCFNITSISIFRKFWWALYTVKKRNHFFGVYEQIKLNKWRSNRTHKWRSGCANKCASIWSKRTNIIVGTVNNSRVVLNSQTWMGSLRYKTWQHCTYWLKMETYWFWLAAKAWISKWKTGWNFRVFYANLVRFECWSFELI